MSRFSDGNPEYLRCVQYKDDKNLSQRKGLHDRFSVNQYGWHPWIFDQVRSRLDGRVLEIGCGMGSIWWENRDRVDRNWSPILTDFTAGMVDSARRRLETVLPRAEYRVMDAQSLGFGDEEFDLVIANHMLYHVPNRAAAIREMHRVLRRGGLACVATNGEAHLRELDDMVESVLPGLGRDDSASRFGLENGAAQLSAVFGSVELTRYPDALRITDVQAVIDYTDSTPAGESLLQATREALQDAVRAKILSHGYFAVAKDGGAFLATKV